MFRLILSLHLERLARLLWGLTLLTLPVTSFRYMPDFMGRTLIQPLAFYPLTLLLLALLVIFWRKRSIPLPSNSKLLLTFLIFVMIGSLMGMLYTPIPLRGASYDERVLRAGFSLLAGLAFFFAAFWMTRSEKDLEDSLKWLFAGLALTLTWSAIQAVAINTDLFSLQLINRIQLLFSARPLLSRRVSGFAYEPAWLADQMVILYLPWLFAALLSGRAILRRKWLGPLFILVSLIVLIFTYSRGGLATALVCIALVFLLMGRHLIAQAWAWFIQPFRSVAWSALLVRVGLVLVLVIALVGAGTFLARYDYFARLWDFTQVENIVDYISNISAGPRLAYAEAGYQVFEQQPLMGVGFGASGLYLLPRLPDWSFNSPEIARQLSPDSNLIPNIKNLYVRLLAETGLPGFWLFTAFFLSFLAVIRRMAISKDEFLRFVAMAGLFAWVGVGLRNFTQDSFTFPIMWVTLGIIIGLAPYSPKNLRLGKAA